MRTRGVPALVLLAVRALLGATPGVAGTIEVRVHAAGGAALAGERVFVRPNDAYGSASRPQPLVTDADGRVIFRGMTPGAYDVTLTGSTDATTYHATLLGDDDTARVDIAIARQSRVDLSVVDELPRKDCPVNDWVELRELATGATSKVVLQDGYGSTELPRGLWEGWLVPAPGFVLAGIDRDGEPLDGSTVPLDLRGDPRTVVVRFLRMRPSVLSGRVTSDRPLSIEATLLEPGAWHAAALARGGSVFDHLHAYCDAKGFYWLLLPSGVWDVRPAGRFVKSEPESRRVDVSPAGEATADFVVELADARTGSDALGVRVSTPDGGRAAYARVLVYGAGPVREPAGEPKAPPGAGGAVPLGGAQTEAHGGALISGLPKKTALRVVAGHVDWLEGEATVGASADHADGVAVRLERGGRLALRAHEDERPLPGVRVGLERRTPLPEGTLRMPELDVLKANREVVTDASGKALVQGLDRGTWRVRALPSPDPTDGRVVRVLDERGKAVEDREVEVVPDVLATVELVVVPAARFHARLACTDGRPLPRTIDVRAFAAGDTASDPEEAAVSKASNAPGPGGVTAVRRHVRGALPARSSFARDGLLLEPETGSRVVVGPLEPGAYRVAFRPARYDDWTWAPGTEASADAAALAAAPGQDVDLGTVLIDCAPRARVRLVVDDGARGDRAKAVATSSSDAGLLSPTLHLEQARVRAEVRRADGSTDADASRRLEVLVPTPALSVRTVEAKATPQVAFVLGVPTVVVRSLPVAKGAPVVVRIEHRHVLPGGVLEVALGEDARDDGEADEVVATVHRGGTLHVAGCRASLVRLSRKSDAGAAAEAQLVAAPLDGGVQFGPLVPGRYQVDECQDEVCAAPLVERGPIDIAAGEDRVLE